MFLFQDNALPPLTFHFYVNGFKPFLSDIFVLLYYVFKTKFRTQSSFSFLS